MKEATGEVSSAIVVVISVAIFIAFFSYAVWPMIKESFDKDTACSKAVCATNDTDGDGKVDCRYEGTDLTCPYKG